MYELEEFEQELKLCSNEQLITLYWFGDCLNYDEYQLLQKEVDYRDIKISY